VDYKKLAEELGGRAEPQSGIETPAIDYKALAEQYGGVQKEEEQPLAATPEQPLAEEPSTFLGIPVKNILEAAKPEPFTREVLDVPLKGAEGVVTTTRAITEAFGANSEWAQNLRGVEKYLADLASAQSKQDFERIDQIMKEAEDEGVGGQLKAALEAFTVAPVDMLSQAAGSTVPILLAAVAGTPGVLTAAGLTGAGIVKGTIYDAVKEELLSRGQDEATAEAKAQEAQAYGGKNLDMILAGTVLGMVAGRTGAERLILNRIATKAAAKEAATAGAVRRGFAGAIEEGAPEFVQAAQERLAENIALQREGFDVPTMRGVVGAGALEGITGGVLGGGIGALPQKRATDTPEDKLITALDEAAAVEEANLAAAAAAQEDAEEGVTDFGQTDTQMGKPVTGQREPSISVPSQPGVLPTDAGAGRIEPTGLDDLSGAPQVIGRREEPVGGALTPAVNPEDTFIIRDIAGTGNEGLVNYFRTYYGLKPESMPKAASIAMPLLQRADQLLARYSEAMLKSNQPHLDEPIGSMSRLGLAKTTMLPEYQEASRLAPGGLANRLVQKAMALDKGYKRANQSQFDGAVKEMQVSLNEFEQALGTLPPPISDAEKQTLRQKFEEGVASSVPKVPKERQVAASLNLLRKGLYSPSMLTDQLDAMVATGKVSYEELDKFEDAKAQKDLKDLQEGKITQATYDARQAKTDAYFKSRMGAPTTPTEPTAPQARSFVDLTPEQQKGYNAELKPYADKVKAAQKQFTEEQKAKGVPFTNAFATWQDMPHPSKDEFVAAAKDLDAKYGIRQYGEASTPATQEGPKFAEEEFGERQGKLKSDEEQMLRIFSGSMYGAGIQDVAVKELLQNAFDSVKEAVYKGVLKGPGKIDIILNDQDRTITVTDNGIGMTTQIVDDGFFTVGGTKKDVPPELRSGGYGIAKVAFMTSTAELSLDTVRDGVRNIVAGATPVQIRNGDFVIKTERASKDEHGTTVVVKIPETYIDRNGKENNVYFIIDPSYITPLKRSLVGPVEVNFTGIDAFGDIETQVLPIGKNFDDKKTPFLTKVNFDWGTADIYYGVERKNAEYGDDAPKHEVLSSGVYQFNGTGGYSSAFNINLNEKIPYDIVVNIKPSVPASDPSYPFTPEREKFRESHKEDIAALTGYLAQIARGTEAEGLQDVFKDIISMPKVAVGGVNKDVEGKLRKLFNKGGHKTAAKAFVAPKEINVTKGLVKDTKGVVLVDTTKKSERAIEKSFEADKAAPKMEQFMNEMTQDPRQPIFHNNTNVNFIEIGEKYGDPQAFFAELGSLFVDMKEAIADGMYAYSKLKAPNLWFTGISVDKGYGGVSILVPFKGNLINPFYTQFGEKTLSGVRERMLDTMIHELAHSDARSHGQPHNTEMIKIKLFLTDNGKYDIYRDKLLELLVKHESTFSAMKEAYDRSTTKNTAKSLEQYEKTSASRAIGSDAGISEDQPGAVSAGERPTRRSDIFSPSGADTGVPIGTRVIGESEITDVETKALQLSLKIGDIHPTIVEAISNNDLNGALRIASQKLSGFSAELAKQLLSLNLPTNISFNTGRDLVRRSIDFRTANQQKRLFDYVRRNYESLYNKYFTNYDLEQVYVGLKELAKDSYKLGPVDAEYNDVLGSFNKNMDGIVAPGGYFDVFDEITLNTNTLTGKSYRVMLHEIVHAATQYVLTTDPKNLTAEQLAAREELTRMYNYAVKKVPPGQYGLTNIFEFVSEVMTNKQFQNYLKNIPYTPRKKPFFQRFVAAVMKLVGIDNLAGAAILEANRIFSATRERDPVYSGPRFAKGKRVRGPISTPQTWRTNEQVLTGMTDVVEDAIKGRESWADVVKTIMPAMWDTSTTVYRKTILGFANLRQIDDLTKTKFPQISGAIRLIEQMVASRLKKLNTAGEIIDRWTKAQAKKPKQSELLSKVMLESTIRGIDPSDPKAVLNAPLQAAWNGLDKEFKDIYVAVKKYYENSVNEMVKEMKRRALGLPKAERQAMIKKINSQFGPDKLTKPYFPLRRFGQYWFQVGKGNFKEFYEFESILDRELSMRKRQAKLSRGNAQQRALAQTIRKGNGLSELYSQNITTTQVLREAQELINNLTANDVPTLKTEMQDSLNQLIYLLLPQSSMRKMFINRKAIQGASGDMLRVFATNAVHSAYQQSRFKYAEPFLNNLNKAREYVDEFASTDRAAVYRDYIEEVEKRSKTILSNEDTSLAAKAAGKASELTFYFMLTAPFTAMLNILGFAQITMPYIGGRYGYTKANAVILKNMYRYLATSPKRTFAPLATGRVMQMQFPSIVEGGKLTGRLKDAADRFVEEGQINISITNDIFGLGDRPSELYTGRYNALKRAVAALFHQSERLNREVGLLSTFELAYERYKKEPKKDLRGVIERDAQGNPVMNTDNEAFEKAIVDAKDIVSLSLGDFTRQMKPRFFTPPLLSVLTKFKQYPVLATYAVFRNFYLTFGAPFRKAEIKEFRNLLTNQGLSQSEVDRRVEEADTQRKELYREGRRRLAGMLGVTFLLGGVEAMPFFTLGIGTIVKMFADEDDDEFFDWENWFRNYMETELGGAAEDLFAKMGMNPEEAFAWGETTAEAIGRGPASAITGGSLSERVSLDPKNLWWRDGRTGSTTRENVIEDVIANSGPVVGLGFNWIDAIDLFNEGKYQRAFEKAAPAIVSKPVAAARIEEEGPRTRSGVLQTDNFSAWELAMQAVGLQPERLAQAQKSSIEAKRYEQSVLNKQNALLDRLWLERGNSDNFNEILQEAMKFSIKHPNVAITPEVIQDSFERRTKGAAEADAIGGKFDKRMLPEVLQMMRYGK
jgi:hypothetical protein